MTNKSYEVVLHQLKENPEGSASTKYDSSASPAPP